MLPLEHLIYAGNVYDTLMQLDIFTLPFSRERNCCTCPMYVYIRVIAIFFPPLVLLDISLLNQRNLAVITQQPV